MYTAMPLVEGKINLTSGTHTCDVIHCEDDGDITITWRSGSTPTTVSLVQGDDRIITSGAKYITIDSGTFSLS